MPRWTAGPPYSELSSFATVFGRSLCSLQKTQARIEVSASVVVSTDYGCSPCIDTQLAKGPSCHTHTIGGDSRAQQGGLPPSLRPIYWAASGVIRNIQVLMQYASNNPCMNHTYHKHERTTYGYQDWHWRPRSLAWKLRPSRYPLAVPYFRRFAGSAGSGPRARAQSKRVYRSCHGSRNTHIERT